jgi:hypothetical protein
LCPQFRMLPFLHFIFQEHNCFIVPLICFLACF